MQLFYCPKPFKTARDNVLETLSLVTLTIIASLSAVRSIYYGEDLDSSSKSLLNMINIIESILTITPIAVILSLVTILILCKMVLMFRSGFQTIFRRLKLINKTNSAPLDNYAPE